MISRPTFENDLRKSGVLRGLRPALEAFNLIIINEYTRMPDHNVHGTMPFNYCIITNKIHRLEYSVSRLASQ